MTGYADILSNADPLILASAHGNGVRFNIIAIYVVLYAALSMPLLFTTKNLVTRIAVFSFGYIALLIFNLNSVFDAVAHYRAYSVQEQHRFDNYEVDHKISSLVDLFQIDFYQECPERCAKAIVAAQLQYYEVPLSKSIGVNLKPIDTSHVSNWARYEVSISSPGHLCAGTDWRKLVSVNNPSTVYCIRRTVYSESIAQYIGYSEVSHDFPGLTISRYIIRDANTEHELISVSSYYYTSSLTIEKLNPGLIVDTGAMIVSGNEIAISNTLSIVAAWNQALTSPSDQ